MKKTTSKKFKPVYTVNITDCVDAQDVLLEFAKAKHGAGLPITDEELEAIIDDNSFIVIIRETPVTVETMKRKAWYKRFWNWLTRKKN